MSSYYQVEALSDHCRRIYSPLGVYMDLIIGQEKALLWDSGYGLADLKDVVRRMTKLPLVIVNSHGHLDHVCGNYQFDEPVYIHEKDIALCREHCAHLRRALILDYASHCPSGAAERNYLADNFDKETYLARGTGKLIPVKENHQFDLGGIHLRVIELPGHTRGSIGLLYEEENTLYVGDALNDSMWLFLPEAMKLEDYRLTLRKTMNLNVSRMVFSHRPGYVMPEVLSSYLALTDTLDYERGVPFSAPLVPGATAKLCCRNGYTPDDIGRPGFASIVINKDHL